MITLDQLIADGTPIGTATLRTHRLGDFAVTSGELVGCDPLYEAMPLPFTVTVAPGRYSAALQLKMFPNPPPAYTFFDIAALVVRFADRPCARWQIAVTPEDRPRPGEICGFLVETATVALLDVDGHVDLGALRADIKAARDTPPGGALVNASLAVCRTGSDGLYAIARPS